MARFGMGRAVNDYTTVDDRDIAIVHSDNGTPICYWVLDEHRAESKTLRFDSNGVFYFLFFFDLVMIVMSKAHIYGVTVLI